MTETIILAGKLFAVLVVLAFCGVGFKLMQPATSSTPVKDGVKLGVKYGLFGALILALACIGASALWLWLN